MCAISSIYLYNMLGVTKLVRGYEGSDRISRDGDGQQWYKGARETNRIGRVKQNRNRMAG